MTPDEFWKNCCLEKEITLPPPQLLALISEQGRSFDYSYLYKHASEQQSDPYGENILRDLPLKPRKAERFAESVSWLTYLSTDCAYEHPVVGYDLPGKRPKKCLVTSYNWGRRGIVIDLEKCGIESWILDLFSPTIVVEEKHAPRADCGAIYKFSATLYAPGEGKTSTTGPEKPLTRTYEQWANKPWTTETIKLVCGRGIRRVSIFTAAKDTQCWAGNYGMKFADTAVRLEFPLSVNQEDNIEVNDPKIEEIELSLPDLSL